MDLALLFPYAISFVGLAMLLANCFLYIKKIKGKDNLYRIITYYLTTLLGIEIFCNLIGILKPSANIFISHFFFNFQFLFLSIFFYFFYKNTLIKKIIIGTYIVISITLLYQYISEPKTFWEFNIFEVAAVSFILIIYSLGAVYQMLEDKSPRYYYFLIGLILYLLPSSIIFLSGNFDLVFIKRPIFVDIWIFNSLGYIIYQYFVHREWKVLTKTT